MVYARLFGKDNILRSTDSRTINLLPDRSTGCIIDLICRLILALVVLIVLRTWGLHRSIHLSIV